MFCIVSKQRLLWPTLHFKLEKGENYVTEVPEKARKRIEALRESGLVDFIDKKPAAALPVAPKAAVASAAKQKKPPTQKADKPKEQAKPPATTQAEPQPGARKSPEDELAELEKEFTPGAESEGSEAETLAEG